jgi:hypothetical protein
LHHHRTLRDSFLIIPPVSEDEGVGEGEKFKITQTDGLISNLLFYNSLIDERLKKSTNRLLESPIFGLRRM